MGDIFQILIIIGFIVFAIFRQLSKKVITEENERTITYPEFEEEPEEITTITPPFLTTELNAPSKKFQRSSSISGNKRIQASNILPESSETEVNQDFNIHSIEEVRKAVIWSEILNRKY